MNNPFPPTCLILLTFFHLPLFFRQRSHPLAMLSCQRLPPLAGQHRHHAWLQFAKKLNSPIAFARQAAAVPLWGYHRRCTHLSQPHQPPPTLLMHTASHQKSRQWHCHPGVQCLPHGLHSMGGTNGPQDPRTKLPDGHSSVSGSPPAAGL